MATSTVHAAEGWPTASVETTPMPSVSPSTAQEAPLAHEPSGIRLSAAMPDPTAGSGTLSSPESHLQETSTGPHKDGRIRDPVPSKLKGKTDGSKGNFGVMLMEVAGRAEAIDRDAEAKRTSESTEMAAKRAFENGYVTLRRSRFVHLPDEAVAKPFVPAKTPAQAPVQPPRRVPFGPEETKSEQARLLTLLRSLHPVLVVDQICKALAFFGGIPGAPPPTPGGFPESAEANGPGSLFIGWIAEIFPRLGGNSGYQNSDSTINQLGALQPGKRKRGRPKGSKSSKARKDKGVKKGPKKSSVNTDRGQPSSVPNDSWVNVNNSPEQIVSETGGNAMPQAPVTNSQTQAQASQPSIPVASGHASNVWVASLPGPGDAMGAPTVGIPSKRKRGRPKGSRNRPKVTPVNLTQTPEGQSQTAIQQTRGAQPHPQARQTSQANHPSQPQPALVEPQLFTAVNSVPRTPDVIGPRGARDVGYKRQRQEQVNQPATPSRLDGTIIDSGLNISAPSVETQLTPGHPTPQAVQVSQVQAVVAPTHSTTQIDSLRRPGHKRKKAGNKEFDAPQSCSNSSGDATTSLPAGSGGAALPLPNELRPLPRTSLEPPPKRQRKNNEHDPQAASSSNLAAQGGEKEVFPRRSDPYSKSSLHTGAVMSQASEQTPNTGEQPRVSVHLAQQRQLEAHPSTARDFGTQLQAQFGEQTELESQTLALQSGTGSTRSMAGRLSRQKRSYLRQSQYEPQQEQPEEKEQQQSHPREPVGHSKSPSLQQQTIKTQSDSSPLPTDLQTRPSQKLYRQHHAFGTPLQQQQQRHPSRISSQTEHPQQPQQHCFPGGQQRSQTIQVASAQQYSGSTARQQYAPNQQQFAAAQQHHAGDQQRLGPQSRHQHQFAVTSSAGATTYYATHPSSQFGASANKTLQLADGSFRNLGSASSNSLQDRRSHQMAASPFKPASTPSISQHSPPFSASSTGLHQRSGSTSQSSPQAIQGLTNVQAAAGNAAADWGLFDTAQLDTSGQQGTIGLSSGSYTIGAPGTRASSTAGPAFTAAGLAAFDVTGLGGSDRCYGRR